jgi:Leucine-rich repeat (LRR) protein
MMRRTTGWRLALVATALCGVARGDDAAVLRRLDALGRNAVTYATDADRRLTEIAVVAGAELTPEDLAAFADLAGLRSLQIQNCRSLDDTAVEALKGLAGLETLAITNSSITDAAVATIAASFPGLVDLDLSSNTNLTGAALRSIAGLGKLQRLNLMQCRFNDIHTRRLAKLPELEVVDLRGNMEAGDLTLDVLGKLPKLRALKHRSSTVTDDGIERLAASGSLASLLAQDFVITDAAGPALARIGSLDSLEIFRCQGFGSEGVLALAPLKKIERLTLRDLPNVGDAGLAVLGELPALKRLYLHELASVGDAGLAHLAQAKSVAVLDLWSLPQVTDASAAVIAALPGLKELSIRETGITAASLEKLAALPGLQSLTFKDSGPIPADLRAKLAARKWKKLDLGSAK